MFNRILVVVIGATLLLPSVASASTDQSAWPAIDGVLLMNKLDGSRPLDARWGQDPFGGQDPTYAWDQVHKVPCSDNSNACMEVVPADDGSIAGYVIPSSPRHNKLLGGHGSDSIFAGPTGDVIWGDYKPGGQPTSQVDTLVGGDGPDFIYASWGKNTIDGGAGKDFIKVFKGRGLIDCGAGRDTLNISRRAMKRYQWTGCEKVTNKTIGR